MRPPRVGAFARADAVIPSRVMSSDNRESVGPGGAGQSRDAWRAWLSALATDADAAMAAAMAYESLDAGARAAWLDALDEDVPRLGVPAIAAYAPLLAVERDDALRARMAAAIDLPVGALGGPRALAGGAPNARVCVVAVPLYLSFFEVLVCRYSGDLGVASARREALRHERELAGLASPDVLAPAPIADVIDELAHAVLADLREGRTAPADLAAFSHLFGVRLEAGGCAA